MSSDEMNQDENWDAKQKLLHAALAKYAQSKIESALQFELAIVEYEAGKKKEAKERMAKVGDDTMSVDFFYNPVNTRGFVDDKEIKFYSAMCRHFTTAPNLLGDEALMRLADWQFEEEDAVAAWKTLSKLAERYPEGDRVKEDQAFLAGIRKQFPAVPERYNNFEKSTMETECFQKLRRPHLQALLTQLAHVGDDDFRKKANISDAEGAMVCYRLVAYYSFLLVDSELGGAANLGITFLNRCKAADWKGPNSVEGTKKQFKEVLDGIK